MAEHDQPDIDRLTGQATTGHEWDGIRELNTPLPRWWLWIFYATIVWSIGYWIVYPAWPLVSSFTSGTFQWNSRSEVATDLGVPREAILMEEESQSTEENAEYARRALGPGDVLVVSDAYHVTRGARVFGRYFDEVDGTGIRGAPLGGALREVAALAIYALLGRLDGPHPVPVGERLATRAVVAISAERRGRGSRRERPRRRACAGAHRPVDRSLRPLRRRICRPWRGARRVARPSRAARGR